MANGGDDDAGDDVVSDGTIPVVKDDYSCVNGSSHRVIEASHIVL